MGKAIEKIALQKGHEISHVVSDQAQLIDLVRNIPDVAVEFTQPESAPANIRFCIENAIPVISGTTGWLDQYDKMTSLCRERNSSFLHSSNFSIGVNLFFELNEWLASKMEKLSFTSSMEEIHHTEKKDSPSGTAIKLAEGIIGQIESIKKWTNKASIDHTTLGIVSKRIPDVPGTHTVSYKSDLEAVEITHTAHSRSVFAEGTVLVAEWIRDKTGVFTMTDFLNK